MRRRSFRPTLESLDFRITPSNVIGIDTPTSGVTSTGVVTENGYGGSEDDNENPLWNTPSDPGEQGDDPDINRIWIPPIGG